MSTYVIQIPNYFDGNHTKDLLFFQKLIPPVYEFNGNTYKRVVEQVKSISSNQALCGVDLRITLSMYVDWLKSYYISNDIYSNILNFGYKDKLVQQVCISRAYKKLKDKLPKFTELKSWDRNVFKPGTETSLMIVKPKTGARGIGHIVFNYNPNEPDVMEEFICTDVINKDLGQSVSNIGENENITYISPRDRHPHEGLNLIREGNYFYQEYKSNISREFRALTNSQSQICELITRVRYSVGVSPNDPEINLYQASTDGEDGLGRLNDVFLEEINTLLSELEIPLHSVDIFFTKDGKWGILEYSTEFGMTHTPFQSLQQEAFKLIEKAVKG